MNKKFVYQVGNNKKSYTMMHGQPNIKSCKYGHVLLMMDENIARNM